MTNYSVYPDAIDGYSTLPLRRDRIDEIVAADHNRLRDAIVKIEQELGIQPSGTFATVRSRLDSIGDASALIEAHLIDAIDAHDASAISILDSGDHYVSTDVEGAIGELAAVLPSALNTIGSNTTGVPNSGLPNFVSGTGSRFGLNTAAGTITKKTQPINITGLHIIEIGDANDTGTGILRMASAGKVQWQAPGDAFGGEVTVSSMSAGDVVTVSSSTTSKKIRLARTSASLPSAGSLPLTDTFDVFRLDAESGAFSITSVGITTSNYITRTATSATGTSKYQFVIGGVVFPADKGTLVLQRKLRGSSAFAPIAALDLSANFTESLRSSGQPVYCPSLTNYDTITLYDRYPARPDYETLDTDADGNQLYDNYDLTSPFVSYQLAKYMIPVSNADLVGGTLEAPTDTTLAEINDKVSAYRIVHYKAGVTDFNGEPAASDILNVQDTLGAVNDGDNNVRISNVYVDSNTARPSINQVVLRPRWPDIEAITKFVSGVNYYNSGDDLFDLEIRSNTDVFTNAYLSSATLKLTSDALYFVEGDGYGENVNVTQMMDDGYALFSNSNVPLFADTAYYLINNSVNPSRRLYPGIDKFSTNAFVKASFDDPFGSGTSFDAYGFVSSSELDVRVMVNSFNTRRATNTQEWFTDESRRIGTGETFSFNLEREQYTHAYPGGAGTLTVWDNQLPIAVGELQCGGRFDENHNVPGLVYPQSNYSSGVVPYQDNAPNYSTDGYWNTIEESYYQRLFNLGHSTNGGRIRITSGGDNPISFNDISYANANRCIVVYVRIPGSGLNSTGWLDVGRLFSTGKYESGDGALYGEVTGAAGDFTVPFTFGTRNSDDNEDMIAVRVSYLTSHITTVKRKIMTMIQILD